MTWGKRVETEPEFSAGQEQLEGENNSIGNKGEKNNTEEGSEKGQS